jgi:hypothetical protein
MLIEVKCRECHNEGGYDLVIGDESTPTPCECSNGYRYIKFTELDLAELIEEIEYSGIKVDKFDEMYHNQTSNI